MKKRTKIISIAVLSLLVVGIVSASLLVYFGRITTTVDVEQSILLDDDNYLVIQEDIIPESAPGGEKFCFKHWLKNQMSVEGSVEFDTGCSAVDLGDNPINCDGVTTSYLEGTGYSFTDTTGTQPVEINVENGECTLTWTIDFPGESPYDEPITEGNGHWTVGLIIATDGEGEGPLFQIHNNDGTDATYEWGTWLYSPWGPTINDGWMGWHSGSDNTPLTELDWVSATGGRYNEDNPDGLFTITIDKCKLGEFGEGDIHWALNLAIGSGFYGEYMTYEQMAYPIGIPYFDWANSIVATSNYEPADVMDSVTGTTIPSGEEQPFCLCYEFDELIMPGTYTITTDVIPTE